MTRVVKWNKKNLRKFEKETTKEMNKRIANVNRKLNPIRLSAETPDNLSNGVTINTVNNDHSIQIDGDINNSQIGGNNNYQINEGVDAEGILREIYELSKTIKDKNDLNELSAIISELQESGKVDGKHKSFFEKHPLIAVGFSAVMVWAAQNGLDNLVPIIQAIFTGRTS